MSIDKRPLLIQLRYMFLDFLAISNRLGVLHHSFKPSKVLTIDSSVVQSSFMQSLFVVGELVAQRSGKVRGGGGINQREYAIIE